MNPSSRENRITRHKRIRAKIKGTDKLPRFSLFRSNKHLWVQLIDDEKEVTMVEASDLELDKKTKAKRSDLAGSLGELVAKKAQDKKIDSIVFDRSGYRYHGLIKMIADGARRGGLKF